MPDQRVLCVACGYLVRPEHFDKCPTKGEKAMNTEKIKSQLTRELARTGRWKPIIENLSFLNDRLVRFSVGHTNFWAKLTKTGRVKKYSLRLDI